VLLAVARVVRRGSSSAPVRVAAGHADPRLIRGRVPAPDATMHLCVCFAWWYLPRATAMRAAAGRADPGRGHRRIVSVIDLDATGYKVR
jgi:hypothetical protein